MLKCFFVVLCALCAQSRLDKDVLPLRYHLNLNLTSGLDKTSNYTGSVVITLNVTKDVQNFTFHASPNIRILKTALNLTILLGPSTMEMDTPHTKIIGQENVTILSENIPRGKYILAVDFEGKFGSDLEGFYKSSYVTSNGTKKWMASTHFETQGARKAFPCFDEPAMRSELVLELTLPSELHAVSNMPENTTLIFENGLKRIQFDVSPPMPTYLMAWIVSDSTFNKLNGTIINGTTYSVYGRTDLRSQADYALSVTPRVIEGLESFTGVTYASSGMSLIGQAAIPDFSAGAMENWGLVTYRESYLMYDELNSSVLDKQHTLLVIAHELAHQWFGDAVTLDWWSYTWLNEGFARYLQYVVTNKLEPSWMLENQFLTDVFQLSMTADLDSHPLTNPNVTSMDEKEDTFDVVTYGKGASILRMFSSILGEESFKRWLNTYLTHVTQSGGVATPDDLFAALPDVSLAEKFRPWTELAGHPVVNVSFNTNETSLLLSQVREDLKGEGLPTGLQVPIQVVTDANQSSISFVPVEPSSSNNTNYEYNDYAVQTLNSTSQVYIWLGQETLDLRLNSKLSGWYLINVNSTGYYRVLYDEQNWKALRSAISRGELPVLVRAQLISDALSLLKTGYLRPQVAIEFAGFLENEEDLLVWKAALMAFNDIMDHLLEWTNARDALERFVRNAMDQALTISIPDFEAGRHYESVLVMYGAKQACSYSTELCNSLMLFLKNNPDLIYNADRESDGGVLCELTKNDSMRWDQLFSEFVGSTIPTQKARYLNSLTCTVNSTLQLRLLENLLMPDVISLQDFKSTFIRILDAKNGITSAMDFVRSNGKRFVDHVSSKRNVRKMLEAISAKLHSNQMIKEMEHLLKSPVLDLTTREQSELINKAHKSAASRRIVAERICAGFDVACVLTTAPDGDSSASGVVGSLSVLMATIAVYILL